MPDILMRYKLDNTGTNPDNLVRNEPHVLADTRVRTIAPVHGAFFTDGCVVTDLSDGRILVDGLDFSYCFLYSSLSVKFGKEVVGAILVTNKEISSNISVTYQCVGSHYEKNIDALVSMLEMPIGEKIGDDYIGVINRPISFMPLPHTHDLGDGTGFEFLIFAIDKLASVISWGDAELLDSLYRRIDDYLSALHDSMKSRLDSELLDIMNNYKKAFTKQALGLDKIVNMGIADEQAGAWIVSEDRRFDRDVDNRYATLKTLVGFKEALMSQYVSSERTNLGRLYGVVVTPNMIALQALVNGATVIVDSLEATKLSGLGYDSQVFPDLNDYTSRWSITRVSNNVNNRGGTFFAMSMTNGSVFSGVLNLTASSQVITWTRQLTSLDADTLLRKLADHLGNTNNPHGVSAQQVLLGNVKNFPVASKATILSRRPVSEYVTYDGLLLFMEAFMTNNWQIDTVDAENPEVQKNNIIRYTTMFAPCGANACDSQIVLNGPTPVTKEPVPVRGSLVGWTCQGTTKRKQFTDGLGSFYYETEANATDCGFQPPTANFPLKDMNGTLLGYGFPTTGNTDAEATVRLDDTRGIAVCYIYPTATTGRTVEIRNASQETMGFAVNP